MQAYPVQFDFLVCASHPSSVFPGIHVEISDRRCRSKLV